jgi:phage terminase Nu1 subunit (DNA packaging protein)
MAKFTQIQWTIDRAASEFGLSPITLKKRLRALDDAEITPGGKFSTQQICAAIFGDLDGEQLRETRERADKLALANAKTRRDLIELPVVESAWADIVLAARSKFTGLPSKLQSRLGLTEAQTKEIEKQIDEALGELSKAPDYSPKETTEKEDTV